MEVLFHIFYCYWGKENRSLYLGLRKIQVIARALLESYLIGIDFLLR